MAVQYYPTGLAVAYAPKTGSGSLLQGNLANKNGQLYSFDYGNRLREVPGKETYRYDGLGRRVQTTKTDGSQTLWQYSQSGQMLFSWNGPSSEKTHENVYLGGSLVATVDHDWPSNAVIATKYQHTDALGSPVAVTNEAGTVIDRTNYEPYGAAINKPAYDGIGYTGHVMDGATGLTYMQQRYYDPMIGRFLSVDPVDANSQTGASFNRYYYVDNNPYKYVDPDGRHKQDRWYGHNDRDFQRYANEIKKQDKPLEDYTKKELDELSEEWEKEKEKRQERRRVQGRRGYPRDQRGSFNPLVLLKLTPQAIAWSSMTFIPSAGTAEEDKRMDEYHRSRMPTVTVGELKEVKEPPPPPPPPPPPEERKNP